MLVRVEQDVLVEMLVERIEFWSDDAEVIELYRMMYENYVFMGFFDNAEIDVNEIVDNDYVNYCSVVSLGDDKYNDLMKLYEENGLGDISTDYDLNYGYSYIEAVTDNYILVRD